MTPEKQMIERLINALLPFADLMEHPEDYPFERFEATVEVIDIGRAKEAIDEAREFLT